MGEDSQVTVPPAFVALYVEPGRLKPWLPRLEIAQRHELCEDLATSLTDRALRLVWDAHAGEAEVLASIHRGLAEPTSGLCAPEAEWVTRRVAELLNWTQPDLTA